MLTTADKLRSKDKQMLPSKHFFNVNFDNDMIDYAKPSRILMNRYSNDAYWPEYNVSKNVPKVNENQQETYYKMENLSRKYNNILLLRYIDMVTYLKTLFYSKSSGDGWHTVINGQKYQKSRLSYNRCSHCDV